MQLLHSGAACWGETDEQRPVVIPGKVIVPMLLSWVKQRHPLPAARIKGGGFIVFEIVAPLARQRQVVCGTVAPYRGACSVP
jgi:hypothetical protein